MKRHWLLFTVGFAATAIGGVAVAQSSGNHKNMKEMTYIGCIEAGTQSGTFMLTHVMSADEDHAAAAHSATHHMPKMLDLSSTDVKLAPHRGQMVTVMGKTMTENKQTKMMVESLKTVSLTCP